MSTWSWQVSQDQLMAFWKRKHLALHGHGATIVFDIGPETLFVTVQVPPVLDEDVPNAKSRIESA